MYKSKVYFFISHGIFAKSYTHLPEAYVIQFTGRAVSVQLIYHAVLHGSVCISCHAFLEMIITRQIWGIWKLRPAYSPETPNLGQNRWCFVPCDLEIWWMTLENNRAPLLCCFKLCATFHSHEFKPELLSGNAQFGSNSTIFRAVWPWNLTYDLEKE